MDPLSITGACLAILQFIQQISSAYQTIQRLKGLPKAFEVVGQNIPLLEDTLELVRTQLRERLQENSIDDLTKESIETILNRCRTRAKKLKTIFDEIHGKNKENNAREWSALDDFYRKRVLTLGKANRVETLMQGMLDDLKNLTMNQVFRLASQRQVEMLEKRLMEAIDKLSKVEPSIDDAEFEKGGGNTINQTNKDGGEGKIFYTERGSTMNPVFGGSFNTGGGPMNIGMPMIDQSKK